jgi:hypothetical protein
MLRNKFKKEKVFCIGFGKTGTTTIEQVLRDFGLKLGHQPTAELLIYEYDKRNFAAIADYCHSADAFQDLPFAAPYLYSYLDQMFPNSKFILTERDDAEQWYSSIVRFHSKKWADGVNPPNKEQLLAAGYRNSTFAYDTKKILFHTEDDDLYNKEALIYAYETHNKEVKRYFKNKSNFININVSRKEDYRRLCEFFNRTPKGDDFPWLNKT